MVNGDPANFHPVKLGEPAHIEVERDAGVLNSHNFHHGAQRPSFRTVPKDSQ